MFAEEAQSRGGTVAFDNGRTDQAQLPETMSGGVGLFDFDGDGWLDIYAVQGGVSPARSRPRSATGSSTTAATGHFEDVTGLAGLASSRVDMATA